jgi:hypothetical protein
MNQQMEAMLIKAYAAGWDDALYGDPGCFSNSVAAAKKWLETAKQEGTFNQEEAE